MARPGREAGTAARQDRDRRTNHAGPAAKLVAAAAGLDPERFAGHSLRAGLATAAALADVPEHAIMRQTRHRSVEVFRGYVRVASLFKKNAAAAVGL